MTFQEFTSTMGQKTPPAGFSYQLSALWWDGRGDWSKSHEVVQDLGGKDAAWIHAYLHRKEGDHSNASYWYSRAGKPMAVVSLEEEWRSLVEHFLQTA